MHPIQIGRVDTVLTARELECWPGSDAEKQTLISRRFSELATVGKHLEHIYPKLSIENRTAAPLAERDTGSHDRV